MDIMSGERVLSVIPQTGRWFVVAEENALWAHPVVALVVTLRRGSPGRYLASQYVSAHDVDGSTDSSMVGEDSFRYLVGVFEGRTEAEAIASAKASRPDTVSALQKRARAEMESQRERRLAGSEATT